MRKRDNAQAVVLDAFLFLMVCSIVFTSFLTASQHIKDDGFEDFQSYLEKAHNVFLRSTLNIADFDNRTFDRVLTVSQISLDILHEGRDNFSEIVTWMEDTLRNLIPPYLEYRWSITMGTETFSIGSEMPHLTSNLWVSNIYDPVSLNGTAVHFVLLAWYV